MYSVSYGMTGYPIPMNDRAQAMEVARHMADSFTEEMFDRFPGSYGYVYVWYGDSAIHRFTRCRVWDRDTRTFSFETHSLQIHAAG